MLIIDNLICDLNDNKIKYCHWKSNIDLPKAISGEMGRYIVTYSVLSTDQIPSVIRLNLTEPPMLPTKVC